MNNPKISIVTPSFNSAKFIQDCIQSVLNQNYPNFEHIIIDGGSNDRTIEIVKEYSHIKLISDPDEGQSDALNKGFNIATGDMILWLNSDDVLLDGVFNHVIMIDLEWDYLYGNFFLVNEKLKPFRLVKPINYDRNILIYYGPYIPSSGSIFKKSIIDDGIHLNKNRYYNMDTQFFLDLDKKSKKIIYTDFNFCLFRVHKENKSLSSENIGSRNLSRRTNKQYEEYYSIIKTYGLDTNIHLLNKFLWYILRKIYRLKFLINRILLLRFSRKIEN